MNASKKMSQESVLSATQSLTSQHTAARSHTKIVVKYNCGFPNNLFLRGEGIPDVTWEKGVQLTCVKENEWVWETTAPFKHAKFKILINDKQYETGENHSIDCGKSIILTPNF
jgi:hypothetical protein